MASAVVKANCLNPNVMLTQIRRPCYDTIQANDFIV